MPLPRKVACIPRLALCPRFLQPLVEYVGRCFLQNLNPTLIRPSQEMVCGLCACEPGTPHGDNAGEARCRYIFRYYNRVGDGRLTSEEFRLDLLSF